MDASDPGVEIKTTTPDTRRPEDRTLIRALHTIDRLYARIYHDLTVVTPSQLPADGPAILVCNHISSLDPVLLQAVCPTRVITWMMAKEFMTLPVLGWAFRTLEVIPVERSGRDTGPLRAALRDLARGRVVGIFPEGAFSTDGQLRAFHTGVSLMAIKSGAPVYPAYTDGTQRNADMLRAYLVRNRAFVGFGPPVEFDRSNSSRKNLESVTGRIRQSVEELSQEVHHRMLCDKGLATRGLNSPVST